MWGDCLLFCWVVLSFFVPFSFHFLSFFLSFFLLPTYNFSWSFYLESHILLFVFSLNHVYPTIYLSILHALCLGTLVLPFLTFSYHPLSHLRSPLYTSYILYQTADFPFSFATFSSLFSSLLSRNPTRTSHHFTRFFSAYTPDHRPVSFFFAWHDSCFVLRALHFIESHCFRLTKIPLVMGRCTLVPQFLLS